MKIISIKTQINKIMIFLKLKMISQNKNIIINKAHISLKDCSILKKSYFILQDNIVLIITKKKNINLIR